MDAPLILVVDDEKDLREALQTALEAAHFRVITAKNGEEGFAVALAEKPNLMLLDIMMPHVSGHEILAKLRRDSWGKQLKIILLTNSDDPRDITHGIGLESNDYVIKSQTSLKDIVKLVKQHLAGYHD